MLGDSCSSAVMAGGHVVLTGGSTPRRAYQELAQAVRELDVDLGETRVLVRR